MRKFFIFFIFCCPSNLFAQVVGGIQSKGMDMNAQPYGFVKQINADTKEMVGNVYLYEQWFLATIEFVNGSKLENKSIRYNIDRDFLEIRLDGAVKGADGKNVKRFDVFNNDVKERYVRASDFKLNGTRLLGFLLELHTGGYSLYSKTNIKLVKGTYVAALDMGEEDDEYSRKIVYYLCKGNELIMFNPNRRHFVNNFPGKEQELSKYIRDNGLSLKRESDLIKVVSYVNSLIK